MICFDDYPPLDNCENEHSYGEICLKCNKCGRFNKKSEVNNDKDTSSTEK